MRCRVRRVYNARRIVVALWRARRILHLGARGAARINVINGARINIFHNNET